MKQMMYSVSTLVHYIKQTLDNDLTIQSILIKGEVSNFTNHRSGHWYFTLKDKKAKISCVMFSSYASRTNMLLKEGMNVIVTASVSMYEAGGSMQLYVTKVQVDGLGDLFLQLEQIKRKLAMEGLFDPAHKKTLPLYPMNIGIITAKTGAAIQDMLTTISRRWPLAEVHMYPCLVQGIQASAAIIKNLKYADTQGHDVILLARGGGAIEDLWCFNDETLARTVYAMHSVIVSGVGHESDTTLVDYVSDARAATPTAAAELITPDIQEVCTNLASMRMRMIKAIQAHYNLARKQFTPLKQHRFLKQPMFYIQQEQMKLAMHVKELSIVEYHQKRLAQQLQQISHQLATLSERYRQQKQNELQEEKRRLTYRLEYYRTYAQQQIKTKASLLDAYSPLKILSRGYHISYHDTHIVKSVQEVQVNDELTLRMQDGELQTIVKKKETW